MSSEHQSAYREGYNYLRSLIDRLSAEELAAMCPQCPEWSLRDVLAHLMAVQELTATDGRPDWLGRRVVDSIINSDPQDRKAAALERDTFWNDLVASLRPLSIDDLFDRWEGAMAQLTTDQWSTVDFAVHVGDIDEALGVSGSQPLRLHALSLERYSQLQHRHLEASGVAAVRLIGTDPDVSFGDDTTDHQVRGSTYELLRAVTGRLSQDEASDVLDWTTTPAETRSIFPIYEWLDESRRHVTIRG